MDGYRMMLRRLIGGAGGALSRRRFLASMGAATWCAACDGKTYCERRPIDEDTKLVMASEISPQLTPFEPPEAAGLFRIFYALPPNPNALLLPQRKLPDAASPPFALRDRTIHLGGFWPTLTQHPLHIHLIARCVLFSIKKFREDFHFKHPDPFKIYVQDLTPQRIRGFTKPDRDWIGLERTLIDEDLFLVVAHEVFHRIQYSYAPLQTGNSCDRAEVSFDIERAVKEGGARLAEDWLLPSAERCFEEGALWLTQSRKSLFLPCTTAAQEQDLRAPYASALFWKYVALQHGLELGGADTQRVLLETARDAFRQGRRRTLDFRELAIARHRMSGPGHFHKFLVKNGIRFCDETTWGNFLVALALPTTATRDRRFQLNGPGRARGRAPDQLLIDPFRVFEYHSLHSTLDVEPPPAGESASAQVRPELFTTERVHAGLRDWFAPDCGQANLRRPLFQRPHTMLAPFAMDAYRVIGPGGDGSVLLRVRCLPRSGLDDLMMQIVLLSGRSGSSRLRDVIRLGLPEDAVLDRVVAMPADGEAMVIIASREQAGDYSLELSRVNERPLLELDPWNAAKDTSFPADPVRNAWSWQSAGLFAAENRREMTVRIANRGDREADSVRIAAYRRAWTTPLSSWGEPFSVREGLSIPTTAQCRRRQRLFAIEHKEGWGCVDPPRDEETQIYLRWYFDEPITDYCIKLEIDCPNDPNRHLNGPLVRFASPSGEVPEPPFPWSLKQ
jgi:hypothetical protein